MEEAMDAQKESNAETAQAIARISELLKQEDYQGALQLSRMALEAAPQCADIEVRLAFACHKLKRLDEAKTIYQDLAKRYQSAVIYFNLACVLGELGLGDESIACYEKTLQLDPLHRSAHNNLGNMLKERGLMTQALHHFEFLYQKYPEHANAINGLASCYLAIGEYQKAKKFFELSLEKDSTSHVAHTNLGIVLLLLGDFAQGWQEYAYRLKRKGVGRDLPTPAWQQEPLEGKRLFIHAEQGAGDVIQFFRYVPYLKTLGAEIIIEVLPELYTLFYAQNCVDMVIKIYDKIPKHDYHVSLLSLPGIFNTDAKTIPRMIPYLHVPDSYMRKWQERIPNSERLKIGIVWAGNPGHANDANRSIPLLSFLPILQIENIDFYSLQKKFGLEQLAQLPSQINLVNLDADIFEYADTAACIMQLDLVITVDTSVAHLAGALGKPVWTLLTFVPDWRWQLKRDDSPWYPTMRLFRQPLISDWPTVIEQVAESLNALSKAEKE